MGPEQQEQPKQEPGAERQPTEQQPPQVGPQKTGLEDVQAPGAGDKGPAKGGDRPAAA